MHNLPSSLSLTRKDVIMAQRNSTPPDNAYSKNVSPCDHNASMNINLLFLTKFMSPRDNNAIAIIESAGKGSRNGDLAAKNIAPPTPVFAKTNIAPPDPVFSSLQAKKNSTPPNPVSGSKNSAPPDP